MVLPDRCLHGLPGNMRFAKEKQHVPGEASLPDGVRLRLPIRLLNNLNHSGYPDIHHKNIWQLRCIYPLRKEVRIFLLRGLPRYLVSTT